jgi:ribonucleoside-diphosphate reductase alpha chain
MDFSTGPEVPSDDVSTSESSTKGVHAPRFDVKTDASRDALLTEFGKDTLRDRYLLPGEEYQDLFARVAAAYADDADHAQRVYDYISKLWFMPATPVLSNGGTGRGLPISCYLNSVDDSLEGIVGTWNENVWLASKGGGIGTYWGRVRGIALFTASMKMMYGSPVASRVSTSFWNRLRASTRARSEPSLGERNIHSPPSRTAAMKSSVMSTP